MIKRVLAGLLFSVLCCSSQAFAIDVYGFGSYWDKDGMDGTLGAGVGVSIPFILDNFRLDGRIHYFESSDLGTDEIQVTPIDLGAQLHILPDSGIDPYILGGISYNYIDTEKIDIDSEFGGYVGAGVDIELVDSLFKLFGEVLYRFSDIDTISEDDLDISGMTATIGLKIHFF